MKSRIPLEKKEQVKRIFRFGYITLSMVLLSAIFDMLEGIRVSALITITHGLTLLLILIAVYFNLIKDIVAAIIVTVNFFLVLSSIAEGLKSGSYLFILTLIFATPFLVGTFKTNLFKVITYLFISVCSFSICILFGSDTGRWQSISPAMYSGMFIFNSLSAAVMCTIFAFMGINFEVKYREELMSAKNKAEQHEEKIQKQNKHLHEIAFMNAHVVRSPLANILAITNLIETTNQSECEKEELMQLLKTSAQQLDDNIKQMVAKATDKST